MQRAALAALSILLLLVAAACGSPASPAASPASAGYRNLTPAELQTLLARTDPFLLDVHVPNQGYLVGTDARIPYTDVVGRAAELPADRDALIVVYCMSGRMSAIAADDLVRLGYRDVLNLEGGMLAWRAAGYELRPE
jgi:rhodanese-related sulfurtransferase